MKVECDAYCKCYITSTIDSVHYGTTSMSHSPHSTPALSAFVRTALHPLGPTTAQSTSRRTVRTLRRDHGESGRPHASQTSPELHCSLCATAMPQLTRCPAPPSPSQTPTAAHPSALRTRPRRSHPPGGCVLSGARLSVTRWCGACQLRVCVCG